MRVLWRQGKTISKKTHTKMKVNQLVEHDPEGQCNFECKTIKQSCQEVIGYSDTDVAEYLYSSKADVDSLFDVKTLLKHAAPSHPLSLRTKFLVKLFLLSLIRRLKWKSY